MKYHDNTIPGRQYGDDHKLLDNWDPNIEYPDNEYVKIHYRVRTKGFDGSRGCFTDEISENAFDKEKVEVFKKIGWEIESPDRNGVCMTVKKDKQNIYLHPQDFSGIVRKNEVKSVAEILSENKSFICEWVDIYKTYYEISDKEYKRHLKENAEKTKKLLYDNCYTRNKYTFCNQSEIVEKIAKIIMTLRIDIKKQYGADEITLKFVREQIEEMINDSYLERIIENNTIYIRSLRKSELKEKGIKPLDIKELSHE